MAYYIRNKNKVYRGIDLVHGPCWSEITNTTKFIVAAVFTTRKDAYDILKELDDPLATVANDLEYINE